MDEALVWELECKLSDRVGWKELQGRIWKLTMPL